MMAIFYEKGKDGKLKKRKQLTLEQKVIQII